MKINKNGFVLAEAIVVAVFIVGLFSYMAVNILPLLSMYETVSRYNNPNEVYAINTLYDEILGLGTNITYQKSKIYYFQQDKSTNTMSCSISGTSNYSNCSATSDATFSGEYFKHLARTLQIKKLIIFKYTTSFAIPEPGSKEIALSVYFNYEKQKSAFTNNIVYIIAEFDNGNLSYVKTSLT